MPYYRKEKVMNDIKISVLGGDTRQLSLARHLSLSGYETAVWGLPTSDGNDTVSAYCADFSGVRCADPESAVSGSRAVILPLPATTDGVRVNCTPAERGDPTNQRELRLTHLMQILPKGVLLLAGKPGDVLRSMARDENVRLIDYYDLEEVQIKNAVPTVEGAIAIAMRELPITLFEARCTILGYRRIGKRLAHVLHALGAHVTVAARSEKDLALARIGGCTARPLTEYLSDPAPADVLFNTVPAPILTRDVLEKLPDGLPIVELASAPGCMEARAQKQCRQKLLKAPSLPGRTAPCTAGKILFESIEAILRREGVGIR